MSFEKTGMTKKITGYKFDDWKIQDKETTTTTTTDYVAKFFLGLLKKELSLYIK